MRVKLSLQKGGHKVANCRYMTGSLFVTGASGYIGSRVLESLKARKYARIVCLCRKNSSLPRTDVEFIEGDLLEPASYARALEGCDAVLHMAAVTGKSRPTEYFKVNRDGTEMLAAAARRAGVQRFVLFSSIAVKFCNQSRYYYAQSKKEAEKIVAASGLRYTIVRPAIVIGRDAPVLSALARLATTPVIPVFGNGRAPVQPIFVQDLALCVLVLLENPGFDNRVVEIGGPQKLSMEEFLRKIRQIRSGGRGRVVHLPAGIVAAGLGVLERFLLPLMPFTAGQLASFTNDGTAAPEPCLADLQSRMKTVDEVLRLCYSE